MLKRVPCILVSTSNNQQASEGYEGVSSPASHEASGEMRQARCH